MKQAVILLASGFSKRMGVPKLDLLWHKKTLLQHAIYTLKKVDCKQKVIVASENYFSACQQYYNTDCVIFNKNPQKGQSESVKLGLKATQANSYLFMLADQPYLDTYSIQSILQKSTINNIVIPTIFGKRGNPVCFGEKFKTELLSIQGDIGGRDIIKKYEKNICYVELENKEAFFDIDTPEDYKRLLND